MPTTGYDSRRFGRHTADVTTTPPGDDGHSAVHVGIGCPKWAVACLAAAARFVERSRSRTDPTLSSVQLERRAPCYPAGVRATSVRAVACTRRTRLRRRRRTSNRRSGCVDHRLSAPGVVRCRHTRYWRRSRCTALGGCRSDKHLGNKKGARGCVERLFDAARCGGPDGVPGTLAL